MGRPNRDGQPRRPQGLWGIAPPVLGLELPLAVDPATGRRGSGMVKFERALLSSYIGSP